MPRPTEIHKILVTSLRLLGDSLHKERFFSIRDALLPKKFMLRKISTGPLSSLIRRVEESIEVFLQSVNTGPPTGYPSSTTFFELLRYGF